MELIRRRDQGRKRPTRGERQAGPGLGEERALKAAVGQTDVIGQGSLMRLGNGLSSGG